MSVLVFLPSMQPSLVYISHHCFYSLQSSARAFSLDQLRDPPTCKSLFILLESSYVLLATGFGLDLKFGDKKFSVTTKLAETLLNPLDYMAPNPPEKMDIPSTKKRKLIIHFDLNETILVEDAAGGDTREDCFNKILAKNAFVRIPTSKSEQPSLWWDGTPLTLESQDDITLNHEEYLSREEHEKMIQTLVDKLFIGWEWPSGCVPYYKVYKGRSKTFTEHHGKNRRIRFALKFS